jgi:hypothetical protein
MNAGPRVLRSGALLSGRGDSTSERKGVGRCRTLGEKRRILDIRLRALAVERANIARVGRNSSSP